jgi:hypothetical protein
MIVLDYTLLLLLVLVLLPHPAFASKNSYVHVVWSARRCERLFGTKYSLEVDSSVGDFQTSEKQKDRKRNRVSSTLLESVV